MGSHTHARTHANARTHAHQHPPPPDLHLIKPPIFSLSASSASFRATTSPILVLLLWPDWEGDEGRGKGGGKGGGKEGGVSIPRFV